MTQLPNDVLNEIFLHLHQLDKVECMLVCHHWKQIIENSVLYHTIIVRKTASLNSIATKVKENPEIGKKIQQFIIFDNKTTDQNEIDLSALFSSLSNLRTVLSFKSDTYTVNRNIILDEKTQYPWHKYIEHIDHRVNSSFVRSLLSHVCPNLTTVYIYLDEDKDIFQLLKHAPVLKDLIITNGEINFTDLDTLHENTSHLKSLALNNTSINSAGFDDTNYYLTTEVYKCYYYIPDLNDLQTVANWLVYISKKHPNLSELDFSTDVLSWYLPDEFLEFLYAHGWAPFFENTGSKFKKLRIGLMRVDFSRLLKTLDKYGCQIHHLDIPMYSLDVPANITQSQQIHFIETLSLDSLISITYEWLDELYLLKSLEICNTGVSIQLENILDHSPPTLRSLALKYTSVTINMDYTKESAIEILRLESVRVPETVPAFINQNFPNLSELHLISWIKQEIIWELPALSLSVFRFRFDNGDTNYSALIKTYNNNGSRLYTVMDSIYFRGTSVIYPSYELPFKFCDANESNDEPVFTLCCHSLKNIRFEIHEFGAI